MVSENRSPEWIRAYAVLKGPAGAVSSAGGPVSASNVKAYTASPAVRKEARVRLEDLGFSVTRVSPLSITVEAPPEQFETVFHGRLEKSKHPELPSDFWSWFEPPEIPEDLKDKIDTIVLPEPVKLVV